MKLAYTFACLGLCSFVHASSLTLTATADDAFTAYISTSDSSVGTQFQDKNSFWGSVETGTTTLTPGTDYYLHIAARDVYGPPSAFIAAVSLSDTSFSFANGAQYLESNSTDWVVNDSGFNGSYFAPSDLGANGVSPWGVLPGLGTAHWLWLPNGGTAGYFSTKISSNAVPEPATMAVLGLGLAALARKRRKIS